VAYDGNMVFASISEVYGHTEVYPPPRATSVTSISVVRDDTKTNQVITPRI
jgi:hypothetical protein